MGREIQKRKARSSAQKIRQRPKSRKAPLTNPIVARAWDSHQTLSQNYKRLGLAAKLNKHTGGLERRAGDQDQLQTRDGLVIAGSVGPRGRKGGDGLVVGEARIERDEQGRIVRVLDPVDEAKKRNPLGDPLADLDSEEDEEMAEGREAALKNQHGSVPDNAYAHDDTRTETVRALEERANAPAEKYKRKQSEGERVFTEELVRKHGEDYGKMARDMKVNYMQRSEGDLKKRVKKWREAGGRLEGEA